MGAVRKYQKTRSLPANVIEALPNPWIRSIHRDLELQQGQMLWRDAKPPIAIIWERRPELVGQTVVPHTCYAIDHGKANEGCICELLGKPVQLSKIYQGMCFGPPSYCIRNSRKRTQEREFSEDTRGNDPEAIHGYILKNNEGNYLSPGLNWMPVASPVNGYVHNIQVIRYLKHQLTRKGVTAYPAVYRDHQQWISGTAVPFDDLKL